MSGHTHYEFSVVADGEVDTEIGHNKLEEP